MDASKRRLVKDSVFAAVSIVKVSQRVTDEIEPARGRVLDVVAALAPVASVEVTGSTWLDFGREATLETASEHQCTGQCCQAMASYLRHLAPLRKVTQGRGLCPFSLRFLKVK